MKRIISMLVVSIIVVSLFASCGKKADNTATSTTVTTTEAETVAEKIFDDISSGGHKSTYGYVELDDGTIKITSYKTEHTYDDEVLRMPAEIDGKTVTVIGESAFKNVDKIIEFKIPYTLVKIEKEAFAGSAIVIADLANSKSLKEIGDNAFKGCESLAKIELPDSLEKIGSGAFSSTAALKYVTVRGDLSILDISQFEGANLQRIFTREGCKGVIDFAHKNKIPVYTIDNTTEL